MLYTYAKSDSRYSILAENGVTYIIAVDYTYRVRYTIIPCVALELMLCTSTDIAMDTSGGIVTFSLFSIITYSRCSSTEFSLISAYGSLKENLNSAMNGKHGIFVPIRQINYK